MTIETMTREFRYDSVRLPDPNPKLSIEEVRTAFSATYPEIATAAVTGPEAIGKNWSTTSRRRSKSGMHLLFSSAQPSSLLPLNAAFSGDPPGSGGAPIFPWNFVSGYLTHGASWLEIQRCPKCCSCSQQVSTACLARAGSESRFRT
jgi:PRTRC genetic system protein C